MTTQNETLIPTGRLRIVNRSRPAPDLGPDFSRQVPVLEQLFVTIGGKERWQDVPVYDEDEISQV